MFSKRSGCKCKSKGKRHFRRRSTRHRRRTHKRKGGGKKEELEAELKALDLQAAKDPVFAKSQSYGMQRLDLLRQISQFEPKEVQEQKKRELDAKRLKDVAALKELSDKASADADKKEAEVMSQFVHKDGRWYAK